MRDRLLKDHPDVVRRKALDPRAFEGSASRAASALSSNQPGEELRPVRVDYRKGAEVCIHLLLVAVKLPLRAKSTKVEVKVLPCSLVCVCVVPGGRCSCLGVSCRLRTVAQGVCWATGRAHRC